MNRLKIIYRLVITAIFSLIGLVCLSACTTTMQVIKPTPREIEQNFTIGDTIKVHTQDHTIITFDFVEVTPTAIVGARERIPFTEIIKIEKPETQSLSLCELSFFQKFLCKT
ncbi:hypothetical protein THII_3078 [Thioploca ingrica]|uniref:Uncharacterized protein n=1 Tax=Thioploca ingrica TaxID=40754 RepID=A0A090APF6_9GAMM|nr:hypothetical protein THII_3078 [Thioploca ingrica]